MSRKFVCGSEVGAKSLFTHRPGRRRGNESQTFFGRRSESPHVDSCERDRRRCYCLGACDNSPPLDNPPGAVWSRSRVAAIVLLNHRRCRERAARLRCVSTAECCDECPSGTKVGG